MGNSIKEFLDKLVEDNESIRLFKDGYKVGATSLLLYLTILHVKAGRKVLLVAGDVDDSTEYLKERVCSCVKSMDGEKFEDTVRELKGNIKTYWLDSRYINSTDQYASINRDIMECDCDVVISLVNPLLNRKWNNNWLNIIYNTSKTVLMDAGRVGDGVECFKTYGKMFRTLWLGRQAGMVLKDIPNHHEYKQVFDFERMKFVEEPESENPLKMTERGNIWPQLPPNVQEEIHGRYREIASICPKQQYELGALHAYESLFGFKNLNPHIYPLETEEKQC